MAGVRVLINSGEVALVASTAKTLLQVKAPANQRVLIRQIRLFGKQAAGGTDPVVKIRATRSTANFGTGTAGTPAKYDPSDSETLQATCATNFTVEPTTPADAQLWWELQPQSGIEEFLPLEQPIPIPGGQSLQLECTSTSTPTLMLVLTYEE